MHYAFFSLYIFYYIFSNVVVVLLRLFLFLITDKIKIAIL